MFYLTPDTYPRLLELIYSKQLPRIQTKRIYEQRPEGLIITPEEGFPVNALPVITPHFLRGFYDAGSSNMSARLLKYLPKDFPFVFIHQSGFTLNQLMDPRSAWPASYDTWVSNVGGHYKHRNVSGYAVVPAPLWADPAMRKQLAPMSDHVSWWPSSIMDPYMHLYDRPDSASVMQGESQ